MDASRRNSQVYELAKWASAVDFDRLPSEVQLRARLVFADSIGVVVRGSLSEEVRRLGESLGLEEGVVLPGPSDTDVYAATLINSFAMGSIEMDEGSRPSGHPALHIVPPVLAAAQARGSSGRELLSALVAGYEVQARLQWATTIRPSVHPHGNFGHVGAAAALARLDRRSGNDVAEAMCVAAGLAGATAWSAALTGSTVRNAFASQSALTALRSRQLIDAGVTGYPEALEETFGRLLGVGFRSDELVRDLGERFYIVSNFFKFHSSCALIHPVLDAIADAFGALPVSGHFPLLRLPQQMEPRNVRAIHVRVPTRSVKLSSRSPSNALAARFSIPFAVAAFVTSGSATPEAFEPPSLDDPSTRWLASQVSIEGSGSMEAAWPRQLMSDVEIMLADGSSVSGSCSNPIGSRDETITESNIRAKFVSLVGAAGVGKAEDHWNELYCLNEVLNVSKVSVISKTQGPCEAELSGE